jgi:prepilin-type N-terminal cleavage/methylation domain-containing protein
MNRGMTLIEVMIAIALIGVISTFTYMTISGASAVAEESSARSDLNAMGRGAMEIMRRELTASFISGNQTEYYKTVFVGTDRDPVDEVYFVARAHEKRYAAKKEGDTAEYGYWSEPDIHGGSFRTIMHREAPIIDDDPETGGTVHALCHNVRELQLRYYDAEKEEWVEEWDSEGSDYTGRVPKAIEIRLELEDQEGRTASFFTRTRVLL